MNQSVHLHSYCITHRFVFISDAGTNPRWVDTTEPAFAHVWHQFEKERQSATLHMRLCTKCADDMVARIRSNKKAMTQGA